LADHRLCTFPSVEDFHLFLSSPPSLVQNISAKKKQKCPHPPALHSVSPEFEDQMLKFCKRNWIETMKKEK
jgi:hypothetical protein